MSVLTRFNGQMDVHDYGKQIGMAKKKVLKCREGKRLGEGGVAEPARAATPMKPVALIRFLRVASTLFGFCCLFRMGA